MSLDQTLSYRGWSIKYTVLNSTPPTTITSTPVVFVHGTPWSSAAFFPLAHALSTQLPSSPILLYDLPGYGNSQTYTPPPTEQPHPLFQGDTSIKFQAEALAALLRHLNFTGKDSNSEVPHIIAHDIAGAVVLRAHLLLHCQYKSLFLMDTNAVLPWGDGFYRLVREEPEVFLKLPEHAFEAMVRATVRSAFYDPDGVLASGWENVLMEPWVGGKKMTSGKDEGDEKEKKTRQTSFIRQIAQANDAHVAEMLDANLYEHVKCPVKILWGEQDTWIPRAKLEKLRELLGEKVEEFVVVPEAGHLVMVERPERVAMEVLGWVGRFWGMQGDGEINAAEWVELGLTVSNVTLHTNITSQLE